jgi:hypothetical protein
MLHFLVCALRARLDCFAALAMTRWAAAGNRFGLSEKDRISSQTLDAILS